MIKKILLLLLAAVVGVLGYAAILPSHYTIAREVTIQAAPEVLFPYLNNTKKANEWMPWAESDPQMKASYSGPDEGVGSKESWDSPGQMGAGSAEIVESVPNQVVKTKLVYTRPMQMTQLAELSLSPVDGGTRVRWSVAGENTFAGRVFCIFMNMDKMVGGEFEKGLWKLKTLAEVPK